MPIQPAYKLSPEAVQRVLQTFETAWLRGVFERALRASLVGAVGVVSGLTLAACSQATDSGLRRVQTEHDAGGQVAQAGAGELDASVLPAELCAGGLWTLVPGFRTTRSVDYLADRLDATVLSSRGTACSGASSQSDCVALLNVAGAGRHLQTTDGELVQLWPATAATGLLGPIDTASEAAWMALAKSYSLPCPPVITQEGSSFAIVDATRGADSCSEVWKGKLAVAQNGTITEVSGMTSPPTCAIGRKPEGLRSSYQGAGRARVGEHFAAMAHFEAASVPAFAAIAAELQHLGAPQALCDAALHALQDERVHTRLTAQLARRFGARPMRPVVQPMPLRALSALALDNAVEGCVFETYAALEASHQAVHARDPQVRAALQRIAQDETRHAHLSWQIAAWAAPQLSDRTRSQIAAERGAAVERLAEGLAQPVDPELCEQAGLPDADTARALHESLCNELWSHA